MQEYKDLLNNAKALLKEHPTPWGFYNDDLDGYVVDANGHWIFGGEACEGYVSPKDESIVLIVDVINSLGAYMKGEESK